MRKSFCLQSVSSARQICESPLNNSSSKNLFAFSKDSRFKKSTIQYQSSQLSCDSIYNIPSTFRKKGAGIGYGKKSDFTKDLTVSPPCSKYQISTVFDKNKTSRKGFTMYQSRQKLPQRGYIPIDPLKVPGPSKYQNQKLKSSPKYSMRKKLPSIDKTMSIDPQNNNPGAGRYQNPQALSPRGSYLVSKHKGTGATLFSPKSSQRFFQFQNLNPGPGRYNQINNLSDQGKYAITKSYGFGKRYFDKQKRQISFERTAKKNINPGPGSYRSPSDFGHYDGDVYRKTGAISYLMPGSRSSSKASLKK